MFLPGQGKVDGMAEIMKSFLIKTVAYGRNVQSPAFRNICSIQGLGNKR